MRGVKIAVLLCALSAACASAGRTDHGQAGRGRPPVRAPQTVTLFIVLVEKTEQGKPGTGACGYFAPPTTRARSGDTIVLEVVNACARPAHVAIAFSPPKPFTDDPPYAYEENVPNDLEPHAKSLVVREHNRVQRYNFRVMINGKPGPDPRLEIEP